MPAKKDAPAKEPQQETKTPEKSSGGGGFPMFFITWLVLAALAYGGYVVWMQMKVQQAKFEATLEQIATTQKEQTSAGSAASLERSTEELKASMREVKVQLAETFEKAADVVQQRSVEAGTQLLNTLSDKLSGLQDRLDNRPQAPAEPVVVQESTDDLLLQAVLNIRQAYQQGRLNRTDLQLAYVLAEDTGDVDAIALLTDLELLLEDGVVTPETLIEDLWNAVGDQQEIATPDAPKTQKSGGFWDGVEQRISKVVRVRKVEESPEDTASEETAELVEKLIAQGEYDDAVDALGGLNLDEDSRAMLQGHISHVVEIEAAFEALYLHLRQRSIE